MNTDLFELRHIGPRKKEISRMLKSLNLESLDQLIDQTIPNNIRFNRDLNLPEGISENSFLNHH
jgi:Glycine cleavage system protein P (pyridoxal-binding), N-terminal domain